MHKETVYFHPGFYIENLKSIGYVDFTPRQIDVLACLLSEKKSKAIARFLHITLKTFETHVHTIMQKIACSSRVEVINYIKKSGMTSLFRKHYQFLLIQAEFEKSLQQVSSLVGKQGLKCTLLIQSAENTDELFMHALKHDLKIANISVLKNRSKSAPIITMFLGKIDSLDNEEDIFINNYIHFENSEIYYFSVFKILEILIPDKKIEELYLEFKKLSESFQQEFNSLSLPITSNVSERISQKIFSLKKRKARLVFLSILFVSILFCIYYFFLGKNAEEEIQSIGFNFIIPKEGFFLKRPDITNQIEKILNVQVNNEIPFVGIIGLGGSGKTTITRYYARLQQKGTVSELNASSKENLITSFKKLAYALAKTKEQREEFDFIQKIQNPEDREDQIVTFVQNLLKKTKKWLLIYDEVENFQDIKKYIPQDPKIWGQGQIILTTRNSNIKNTSYIKPQNIIEIKELSQEEALTLFSKILYNCEPNKLDPLQREESLDFLKRIPSFPLDVSIAAYYIKNEHLTYDQYIKGINQHNKNFEDLQENLLKEVSDYTKTRYMIITSSLEKNIQNNPDFKELLFLICLLEPYNIPKEFLEFYAPNLGINTFLHDLRGSGLILEESKERINDTPDMFSLPSNTQGIILVFLNDMLTQEEMSIFINNIIEKTKEYYDFYAGKDPKRIAALMPHIKVLINNLKKLNIQKELQEKYQRDLSLIFNNISALSHQYAY